jgi:Pyruvate/2-oxoacid:ferredoxin oxidoreductase gamma subunit
MQIIVDMPDTQIQNIADSCALSLLDRSGEITVALRVATRDAARELDLAPYVDRAMQGMQARLQRLVDEEVEKIMRAQARKAARLLTLMGE